MLLCQSDIKKYFCNKLHRKKRIYERCGNYKEYIKTPKEFLWKYKAKKQSKHLMNLPEIVALQKKTKELFEGTFYGKYTDFQRYFAINLRRLYRLQLATTSQLRILDIGSGAGFFSWLCKKHNHIVQGLDIPGIPIFDYLISEFDIPRTEFCIMPNKPMPKNTIPFDYIVAFAICFHELEDNQRWNRENWLFFLDDIHKNYTRPGTKMHLFFNDHPHGDFELVKKYISQCTYNVAIRHKSLIFTF